MSASDLNLDVPGPEIEQDAHPHAIFDPETGRLASEMPDNHSLLLEVRSLLNDGFAGIIFSGPPGTSKSYYAAQIAAHLAEFEPERVRFIQFHPSYQYEDFVEGFIPDGDGFTLAPKHLLEMCDVAKEKGNEDKYCVLVVDELSRSDPGRVFGEALTYVEMTKREKPFYLSSGTETSIPRNLVFLATMNPFDRGVDEVDMAFERRFAKIDMDPDPVELDKILTVNGLNDSLKSRLLAFFIQLQRENNPLCKVGHAYFIGVKDLASLERLWKYQLRSRIKRAFPLDETEFRRIETAWRRVVASSAPASPSPSPTEDGSTT
ncbi:MAG: AAA domain-containing protein [Geobacteraceae bacterium]|nr:AAA domain-containing protein [Geobacteraceae bacterium]